MSTVHFSESALVSALETLSRDERVAFAAACAERVNAATEAFYGSRDLAKSATRSAVLRRVWDALGGAPMSRADGEEQLALCMALVAESEDDLQSPEEYAADDATGAVAYAVRTWLSGSAQEPAWAARRSYEALDHFATRESGVDISKPDAEARLVNNPLIQAELRRQNEDLEYLRRLPPASHESKRYSVLRQRAYEAGQNFFRIPERYDPV